MTDAQWKDSLRSQLYQWERVERRMAVLGIEDEEMTEIVQREIQRIKEGLEG